jgi:hypothetical protein
MTNCEPINCPIPESLRAERRNNAATFVARSQSGVETQLGCTSQKLRLELAPSVAGAFTKLNPVGARI